MSKMAEFEAIKALFTEWAETGVPAGVKYPKTQTEAVGWKCEQFGITGVGSKTYFKTTSEEYGVIVTEIKALIAKLQPEDEVRRRAREKAWTTPPAAPAKQRQYKTQKARRHDAEDRATESETMLRNALIQLHNVRESLASLELSLKVERQTTERLGREKAKLEEEKAQLTRMLAAKSGILQVVE